MSHLWPCGRLWEPSPAGVGSGGRIYNHLVLQHRRLLTEHNCLPIQHKGLCCIRACLYSTRACLYGTGADLYSMLAHTAYGACLNSARLAYTAQVPIPKKQKSQQRAILGNSADMGPGTLPGHPPSHQSRAPGGSTRGVSHLRPCRRLWEPSLAGVSPAGGAHIHTH